MKVTLFFAEGAHDIAFIKLAFRYGCDISVSRDIKISSLPAPLNTIFSQIIKEHFYDDFSLDMAHKFLLPDCVLISKDNYILLFNSGGMKKYSVVKKIISRILYQLKFGGHVKNFNENDLKLVFTYDADYRGKEKTIEEVNKNLFPVIVKDCGFDEHDPVFDKEILLEQTCKNVYYYIWHGSNGFGTLEDILLPIYQLSHSDLLAKTNDFIDDNFAKDFEYNPESFLEHDVAMKADKIKAQITIAGQGKRASKPATAIINDDVLGNRDCFIRDVFISQFISFLKSFL